MSEADQMSDGATTVTIFGRSYHLRGEEDAAYLARLAAVVDRKMNEVAESTGTADTLKVAILASLNIADDYVTASEAGVRKPAGDGDRLARLVARLDEVLDETGTASEC